MKTKPCEKCKWKSLPDYFGLYSSPCVSCCHRYKDRFELDTGPTYPATKTIKVKHPSKKANEQ